MFRKAIASAVLAAGIFVAQPALAQGIGHTWIMRGQVVGLQAKQAVLCIGKADGAQTAQVLDVYRVTQSPGLRGTFRRARVGSVTINDVFDEHFARATVTEGSVAKHDIVELRRN